jgi:hypothetical protein
MKSSLRGYRKPDSKGACRSVTVGLQYKGLLLVLKVRFLAMRFGRLRLGMVIDVVRDRWIRAKLRLSQLRSCRCKR